MSKSLLATTVERMERYEREGRRCRMNGSCANRGVMLVRCEDHGEREWIFCRRHGAQFLESARYYGYCNAANPDSRVLSVSTF